MDFERAAHIINMDLTGIDPGPPCTRNVDSDMLQLWDERSGAEWEEIPDVRDQTTDTNRTFTIEILFDAPTDLEASLATSAVAGFVRRRLGLDNVVIVGHTNF